MRDSWKLPSNDYSFLCWCSDYAGKSCSTIWVLSSTFLLIMLCKKIQHLWMRSLVWPLKWKLLSSTSLKFCLLCCTVSVQGGSNFSVCENLEWCDHWNESQRAVLLCGTVYYALHGCSNFLYFLVKTKVRRLSMHIYIPGWLGFSSSSLTLSAGPVDELLAELWNHG